MLANRATDEAGRAAPEKLLLRRWRNRGLQLSIIFVLPLVSILFFGLVAIILFVPCHIFVLYCWCTLTASVFKQMYLNNAAQSMGL